MLRRNFLFFIFLIFCTSAFCQQDVDFHINTQLLAGKKILRVNRDCYDPYVWVLAENNGVYRINSLTMAVDDYSARFSAYSKLQFIDIVGRSQDTVFVAANSPDVIEYYKGSLRDIGKARGLTDTVNSLGIGNQDGFVNPSALQIGTNHGLANYFVVPDSLIYHVYQNNTSGPVRIFSETYRKLMYTDNRNDYIAPNYFYPVIFSTPFETFGYDIHHMLQSANKISTAYYVPVGVVDGNAFSGSFFWGNSTGLYQESLDYEDDDPEDFDHFLNNVNIHKIADIFGLTNFYKATNPLISKDNLLVGTDNGLYFSSSLMAKFVPVNVAAVNLYHFDPLGNLRINDICVNATDINIITQTECENGVWLGTDNGVYLLNPDYGSYLSGTTYAQALYIDQLLVDSLTNINICQGSSITVQLDDQFINSNIIQWEKNGKDIAGANTLSLNVNSAGEYYAILYDPCENVHIQTNHINVNLISSPVFSFNYPAHIQHCSSATDTLQVDNNPQYHYQWYTNGVFNGDTTSVYYVTNSGKYNVEVSACTNSWVPSTSVQIDFVTLPAPMITSDKIIYCADDIARLSVNIPVDTGYTINWYQNGNLLPADKNLTTIQAADAGVYSVIVNSNYSPCNQNSSAFPLSFISAPVFTFNYPDKIQQCNNTPLTLQTTDNPGYTYRWYTNGVLNGNTTASYTVSQTGKYRVEVSACTNSWVPSKEVEVDLVTLPVPQVTSDKNVYCAEDVAGLTENAPIDPSYTINWYRDGNLLPAGNNLTTIDETTPGSYTVVLASTIASCTQTSAAFPLAFTPAPLFTFNYPAQLQYCTGAPLTLQVSGSADYYYRWYKDGTLNGITTASLPVTANGAYKVEVSSCTGSWVPSGEVQVKFVTVPVPIVSADKPAYCTGDDATLSLSGATDPDYAIQWYKDNVPVPNSAGQSSIVTNVAGNYTATLTYSTPNTDGSTCSQSSAAQAITFNQIPTISIEKIVNTTICEGQTIGLKANYNGGTVLWSTGETTDQIAVTQAGTYTATITSTSGCQAAANMDVAFFPNPVFSVNDTSICTYKKQVVTLTAPPGFAQYAWNGQTGGQTYQVGLPQTVSLTVTDINSCQATQQIKVADQCPNIYIPNTFTPNGDGINDTWVIEGLDNDPSAIVKVFTRNGVLIFESIGYGTPWNGEYKGKKLPAGAYYYIVTAKNGTQKFSGSLTIIY